MADTGGLILISALIQEALSNADSFADRRIKLAPNLMEKVEELKKYLTAVESVVKGAEETQESDLAIRTWLQMLSEAVYDAVDALDEINYFFLQKQLQQDQEHASSSSFPVDGDSIKEIEIQSQEPADRGRGKEVEIRSQKPQEQKLQQEQGHTTTSSFPVDGDRIKKIDIQSQEPADSGREKEVEIRSQRPQERGHTFDALDKHGRGKEVELRKDQKRRTKWSSSFPIFSQLLKFVRKQKLREQVQTSLRVMGIEIQRQKLQEQVHTFSLSNLIVDSDGGVDLLYKFTMINASLAIIVKEVGFIDGATQFRKKNLAATGYGSAPLVDDSLVIGRDNDVQTVLQSLVHLRSQHPISGISIGGMAGIGKTTVAKLIYDKARKGRLYHKVAWVSVPADFNHQRILSEMSQYCDNFDGEVGKGTIEELILFLGKELKMKNILLVLDDLWELDPNSWNAFASYLSRIVEKTEGKCSIVLTTQSKHVASVTVEEKLFSVHKHDMRLLSDGECWSIIEKTVLRSSFETCIQTDLQDIGKEIAKRCRGLPLVAVMIGETLSRQIQKNKWSDIRNDDAWFLNSDDGKKILSALKTTSFDRFSSPLKKCFSYCSFLLKGQVIEKDDLVQLWMSQGFLHLPNSSTMALEDVGNQYMCELLSYSLFEDAGLNEDGNFKECKMSDMGHDLALFISKDETMIWGTNTSPDQKNTAYIRHLRLEVWIANEEVNQRLRSLFLRVDVVRLRSLFLRVDVGEHDDYLPLDSELKSLRSLVLEGALGKIHFVGLGNLKYLRYLEITGSGVRRLQESLSKLHSLETLKLSQCAELSNLSIPSSIKNLRISYYYDLISIQSNSELTSLQSLELRSCYELTKLVANPGNLISLKELRISDCPLLLSIPSIHRASSLESLELRSCTKLTTLAAKPGNLISLKELRISDCPRLLSIPSIHRASSLQSLELKNCSGLTSLLTELGSCISLKNLKMANYSPLTSIESIAGLSSLESLELSTCHGLTSLFAKLGTLNSLKMLNISDCSSLTSIENIGQSSSLESLQLSKCHGLTSLFAGLGTLNSLKILKISDCSSLASIESIGQASSLESLQLSKCHGLTSLFAKLGTLNSLKMLNISDCSSLTSIENIGQASSLESLQLSKFHGLTSLFAKLGTLNSLKMLNISDCSSLTSIENIGQSSSLESLQLSKCHGLTSLFAGLGTLNSLKILKISDCSSLASIESIGQASSLESIELSSCPELRNISADHDTFNSLKRLEISGCKNLFQIKSMDGFVSLESLELTDCEGFVRLPAKLDHCSSLKKLRIEDSRKLSRFESFDGLSSLESLELINCFVLNRLPTGLDSCSSLQRLIIRKCPALSSIPDDIEKFTSLSHLEISECKLKSIPEEWLGSLTNLTELKIGPLWSDLDIFPGLTSIHRIQASLRRLNIRGWDKLKSIPSQLAQLTALEELTIWGFYHVEVLPEWLGNLSSLKRLEIRSCGNLSHLPSGEAMRRLSNIQHLEIRNCFKYAETYKNDVNGLERAKLSHIPNVIVL